MTRHILFDHITSASRTYGYAIYVLVGMCSLTYTPSNTLTLMSWANDGSTNAIIIAASIIFLFMIPPCYIRLYQFKTNPTVESCGLEPSGIAPFIYSK